MIPKNCLKKPWGAYKVLHSSKNYKIKLLYIQPKQRISLQRHRLRDESWIILQGFGKIITDYSLGIYGAGFFFRINRNQQHRISNVGKGTMIILEIQSGKKLLEKDVIRISDDYGRG